MSVIESAGQEWGSKWASNPATNVALLHRLETWYTEMPPDEVFSSVEYIAAGLIGPGAAPEQIQALSQEIYSHLEAEHHEYRDNVWCVENFVSGAVHTWRTRPDA